MFLLPLYLLFFLWFNVVFPCSSVTFIKADGKTYPEKQMTLENVTAKKTAGIHHIVSLPLYKGFAARNRFKTATLIVCISFRLRFLTDVEKLFKPISNSQCK